MTLTQILSKLKTLLYSKTEIDTMLLSKVYPVGAIYISVNNVNPGTLFGGTWEQIKDQFLLSSGNSYAVGTTGGSATTTLAIDNIPSHNHTGTTGNESQGHTHSGTTGGQSAGHTHSGTTGNQSAGHTHTFSGTSSSSGGHTHNTWTDSQGYHSHNSGHGWFYAEPGSDRRCLSDYYIDSDGWSGNITSSTGSHSHNVGMDSAGSHTHTYSGTTSGISANHTHSFTTGGVSSDHTHGFTTGGISAHHTHSFTTSSVGSTQAFSNMPPYLTVNIWKRTA